MAARKKSEEPSINIDEVLTDEELLKVIDSACRKLGISLL